ncbi:phage tail protein I [Zooshikella ganghwensis]|uniref:Phage tail protein I n=1 Tax=Zooshikella ganghwensis TaxID=202772 RepID=A0A4P9VIN0_9GAMM|nr:phage tail protein I [Zooshikella ganghwensis]RDH41512.1 phage tail protein I [Zooshikella ganghwensis]
MNGHKSILPGNLSELERDLEGSLAAAQAAIPVPIDTIWHAYKCPAALLPYLAWAVSVDHWQASWPEHIKRSVIAKSLEVHEIKGTRQAVEKALAAIDIDTKIIEWFEMNPPGKRGTFKITANVTNRGINQEEHKNIQTIINAAKNARSHYDLNVKLINESTQSSISTTLRQSTKTTLYPLEVN